MSYAVNLLPPHLRPKTGVNTKHLLAGAFVGVFLICGGLFGWQLLKEQRAEGELSRLSQEIQFLQPVVQQVRQNKALKAQIDGRTNLLAQIEKERPVKWSDILLQLGQATPEHLWLTEVSSDANGIILIRGGANDIDAVTKYVDKLRQNPNISQVSFVGLVQTNINEKAGGSAGKGPEIPHVNMVTYDLQIRLKGGVRK